MAITYVEQYETKKAVSTLKYGGALYEMNYIARGPVGEPSDQVDATIYKISGDTRIRVGYAGFAETGNSIRFENEEGVEISHQSAISVQYFNDLQTILM